MAHLNGCLESGHTSISDRVLLIPVPASLKRTLPNLSILISPLINVNTWKGFVDQPKRACGFSTIQLTQVRILGQKAFPSPRPCLRVQ